MHEPGGTLLWSGLTEPALSLRLFMPRYLPSSAAGWIDRCHAGATRILVVEDDEAVRRACVEALSKLDCKILEAPDAMEAFRLILDHGGADLLPTDLGLPGGVSGRPLADAACNVDRGIRVVFTTGHERADFTSQLDGALPGTPFSPAQLAGKAREALASGKAGRTDRDGARLIADEGVVQLQGRHSHRKNNRSIRSREGTSALQGGGGFDTEGGGSL